MQQPRLVTESIAGLRPYQEDAVLTKTLADGRLLVAVADGIGDQPGALWTARRLDSGRGGYRHGRGDPAARPPGITQAAAEPRRVDWSGNRSAETAIQRVQSGSLTIQAFGAFMEQAEALNPIPARLQQKIGNARRRIAEIRDRMRRGD